MPLSRSVGKVGRALPSPDGHLAGDEPVEERGLVGVGLAPRRIPLVPRLVGGLAAADDLAGVREHGTLDGEPLLREPEDLVRGVDLGVAEGRAVRLAGVLLGRRGPRDDRLEDDEGRLVGDLLAGLDRREQLVDVLDVAVAALVVGGVAAPVDGVDVPAVGLVALRDVLGERDVGVVLDRDVVLVVDQREVAELLVRGQRGGLVGDALHDVAVGGQHEDVVVEDALTGLGAGVEHLPLPTLGERHPHGRRQTRAERSGGDLDTRGVVHLRVTRSEAAPRAQRLEVLQLQPVAGEVELDVLREAGVPAGQDEPVATQPCGVGRVVGHDVLVEQVGHGRQRHGGAGVTVAGLLDRVGGEDAHRVDGADVEVAPAGLLGHRKMELRAALGEWTCGRTSGGSGCRGRGHGALLRSRNRSFVSLALSMCPATRRVMRWAANRIPVLGAPG